ncbi:hypothetical protein [Streptomyces sp. YKOK-I1]
MTQRNLIAPDQGAAARVATLHQLAREDYAKGQRERAEHVALSATRLADPSLTSPSEPSDLEVAIRVGQQLLDSNQILSVREALRLLLRALGAEPAAKPTPTPPLRRCPAAHRDDPTPCAGPVAVMVLDAGNAGARSCEHHGARLLASLNGGRVYALPDAPDGAAIRVFKAAATTRPYAWVERGEGQ